MRSSHIAVDAELDATYRLTRLLGKGGMGEVWEAEHLRLPKRVAVKFLMDAAAEDPEQRARFRREAEIVSRLRHPNIVEILDYNVLADGTPYLVLEFLRGRDLRARLEDGEGAALALDEAWSILWPVMSALSLAHREGVVHRDLKPENIFLSDAVGELQVKVLDFGISKLQGQAVTFATREHSILGTPGYMAPEQAMGQNDRIDERTDVFALAVIFYEMLTGITIFCGDSLPQVIYKVVHEEVQPLAKVAPWLPEVVCSAVDRALSKEPQQRPASVHAFAEALQLPRRSSAPIVAPSVGDTVALDEPPVARGTGGTTTATAQGEAASGKAFRPPGASRRWARLLNLVIVLPMALFGAVRWGLGMWELGEQQDRLAKMKAEAAASQSSAADAAMHNPLTDGGQVAATGPTPNPPTDPTQPGLVAPGLVGQQGQSHPGGGSALRVPEGQTGENFQTDSDSGGRRSPESGPPHGSGQGRAHSHGALQRDQSPGTEGGRPRAGQGESLPPAVRATLKAARRALDAGRYRLALRLARGTLQARKSSEAFAIMAEAYCGLRDLGMTRAMLRNVRRAHRSQVRAFCADQGTNL